MEYHADKPPNNDTTPVVFNICLPPVFRHVFIMYIILNIRWGNKIQHNNNFIQNKKKFVALFEIK